VSNWTSDTDDPESSITSTDTPPSFPLTSVAVDLIAATVIIVFVCESLSGLVVLKDACCPSQAPHCRFPVADTNNP